MKRNDVKNYLGRLLPLLTVPLAELSAYYASRLFAREGAQIQLMLPMDDRIPLCTPFILVYILAYVQWVLGFVMLIREDRELRNHFCAAHILAEAICFAVFVVFPTGMIRPEILGQSIFDRLTRAIYRVDAPVNLLPSIHCLMSWFCLRIALAMKRKPRWYALVMMIFSLLVMMSTVLVKQHVIVDIPAGILAAEAGLFLSRRFRMGRIFDFADK